jgi:D-alanine-D-alanine ligase-like ATP-grasp enzyme
MPSKPSMEPPMDVLIYGTPHIRVCVFDGREDPESGEIYVLEVNNTCSLAPQSYFEMSVEACGSSKKKILRNLLKNVV